jgi:hypothetical protein
VVPVGGSQIVRPDQQGGQSVTLLRADGSVFATQDLDPQNRPLETWFDLGNGESTSVDVTYGGPDRSTVSLAANHRSAARRAASGDKHARLFAYCGSDSENQRSDRWFTTMNWYWVSSSTPGYLNQTNTLTSLRDAHTEWVNNINWCFLADFSTFSTAYQGTIGTNFGKNGINSVGWGSVAALGLPGCSGPSAIACTESWDSGSTITESDTRFDDTGRTTWFNGNASGKTDVQSVMAHELGHSAGFEHVNDSSNVMYGTVFTGDVSDRELGRGDANEDNAKY